MLVAKLMFSKPVLVKTLVPKPTFPEADVLESCVSETARPVTARSKSDRLETSGLVATIFKIKYSEADFPVTAILEAGVLKAVALKNNRTVGFNRSIRA